MTNPTSYLQTSSHPACRTSGSAPALIGSRPDSVSDVAGHTRALSAPAISKLMVPPLSYTEQLFNAMQADHAESFDALRIRECTKEAEAVDLLVRMETFPRTLINERVSNVLCSILVESNEHFLNSLSLRFRESLVENRFDLALVIIENPFFDEIPSSDLSRFLTIILEKHYESQPNHERTETKELLEGLKPKKHFVEIDFSSIIKARSEDDLSKLTYYVISLIDFLPPFGLSEEGKSLLIGSRELGGIIYTLLESQEINQYISLLGKIEFPKTICYQEAVLLAKSRGRHDIELYCYKNCSFIPSTPKETREWYQKRQATEESLYPLALCSALKFNQEMLIGLFQSYDYPIIPEILTEIYVLTINVTTKNDVWSHKSKYLHTLNLQQALTVLSAAVESDDIDKVTDICKSCFRGHKADVNIATVDGESLSAKCKSDAVHSILINSGLINER